MKTTIDTQRMENRHLSDVLAVQTRTGFQHWSMEQFQRELDQGYTRAFVLKKESLVIGFAIWHLLLPEAELCSVAVDPSVQKNGFGFHMMKSMHHNLQEQGAHRFFLEVRANNQAALALYYKLCYTQVGIRKHYYSDGEDAILMTCEEPD